MSNVVTKEFRRKSFPVRAVQIDPSNMQAVAEWCAGEIRKDGEKEGHLSRDYIKVRVAYPINERQTQAYLGDWVLKSGKSFKVYSNSAFLKSFEEIDVVTPIKSTSKPSNRTKTKRRAEQNKTKGGVEIEQRQIVTPVDNSSRTVLPADASL